MGQASRTPGSRVRHREANNCSDREVVACAQFEKLDFRLDRDRWAFTLGKRLWNPLCCMLCAQL